MTEKLLNDNERQNLKQRICLIKENIRRAAEAYGRRYEDITLVAATKTVHPSIIDEAISCGISNIGENRVQELLSKEGDIHKDNIKVHFIGHLQSNKVRSIVGKVDLIQSVDTFKLAKDISEKSLEKNLITDILLEVNIGKEENKFGFIKENLRFELGKIGNLQGVRVNGLMAIVPICKDKKLLCDYFKAMNSLLIDISNEKYDNVNMKYLSMGMSSDYMEAIKCGANMVRIGSAIFGNRK